ncbi:hypothetical protein [Kribbella jiaozuonensis]|nr:hypothetical protein [Kribbella jiaozuonensis]
MAITVATIIIVRRTSGRPPDGSDTAVRHRTAQATALLASGLLGRAS